MYKKGTPHPYTSVWKKCLDYFGGDDLAASTWIEKYALRNEKGDLLELSPDDMHRRMAREFSRIETLYRKKKLPAARLKNFSEYGRTRSYLSEDKIYSLFRNFRYVIPQGSVMAALGNTSRIASLSNCVVLPEIYDSYGGILFTDQQLAQLFKRRCGVGIDISSLRPAGIQVSNTAGTSSGSVSFMERFSNTTREVAQHGRRGALMITLDIAHPDVEEFIFSKQDLGRITGANISVKLSDEFMLAVRDGKKFTLRWPLAGKKFQVRKTVNARDLWEKIVRCAHNTAEPGLIFWDRQHHYSASSLYPQYKNLSTNPCSEIAMQGGDSCRLIALNLYGFVNKPFEKEASFDYKLFYEYTYEAQRLMDDLVDLELEAIEKILKKIQRDPEPGYIKDTEMRTWKLLFENGKSGRRTGLGFTALADCLAALGYAFDSAEALKVAEKIMQTKCEAEFDSSVDMAIERGPFKGFDPAVEKKSEFVKMLSSVFPHVCKRMMKWGRRNVSISTVAPTGSLSILAQTSSGIEPVYMLFYTRRRKIDPASKTARADFTDQSGDRWQEYPVCHPKLKIWMQHSGKNKPDESPYKGSTATEIDWMKRVEMQAVVQKYVTHSISSTLNLPADVSPEKVGAIYLHAWKKGLKGITIYREGSRSGVLLPEESKGITDKEAPERPAMLEAEVLRFLNGRENWIAVLGLMKGRPYEIFTGKNDESFPVPDWVSKGWIVKNKNHDGESRYDFRYIDPEGNSRDIEGLSRSFNQEYWNYAKLLSGVLRYGMPIHRVIELISNLRLDSESINTWKSGVGRALKKFIPPGTAASGMKCPGCEDTEGLYYEEGCLKCRNCGSSQCG